MLTWLFNRLNKHLWETYINQTGQSSSKRCEVKEESPPGWRKERIAIVKLSTSLQTRRHSVEVRWGWGWWAWDKGLVITICTNSRRLAKLLGLTRPVLAPAESEPGFDLPAGLATLWHQHDYFTLKGNTRRSGISVTAAKHPRLVKGSRQAEAEKRHSVFYLPSQTGHLKFSIRWMDTGVGLLSKLCIRYIKVISNPTVGH